MKLAHYEKNGVTRVGLVDSGSIFDVEEATKKLGLAIRSKPLTIYALLSDGALQSLQKVKERKTRSGIPML